LQPADECECRDIFTAIWDLGQLALEVADVRFEAVALPHLDGEKMMVVPLSFLMRCVLGETLRTSSRSCGENVEAGVELI